MATWGVPHSSRTGRGERRSRRRAVANIDDDVERPVHIDRSSIAGRAMQLSIHERSKLLEPCAARRRCRPPLKFSFILVAALLFLLFVWFPGQAAFAETANTSRSLLLAQQKKHNENVLMILGGSPGTPYFGLAHDIVTAIGTSHGLRLLAIDAPGGAESLRDLLLLRGVDLALVPANALAYANETASF